jgi:hypothetical protein
MCIAKTASHASRKGSGMSTDTLVSIEQNLTREAILVPKIISAVGRGDVP